MKGTTDKRGFILMNTGAPMSTQKVDQQRYLKEVSKDRHVAGLPYVAEAAVHPHRAAQQSTAYKAIWTEEGSPLIHSCKRIRNALRKRLGVPIEIGMLYGSPSVARAIGKLLDAQVDEIGVLPMFPQYSTETFEACIGKVERELRRRKSRATMRTVPHFYSHPAYVGPLAKELVGIQEQVLFSYRGLSLHHLTKPDQHGHCLSSMTCCCEPSAVHDTCYRFQCLKTTQLIAKAAKLPDTGYSVSFQSHHGPVHCIEPYTEDALRQLPQHGCTRVAVICPAHFCDGVETLEEIEIHGKEIFMEAGGESFRMIHGLNDSEAGIQCLESLMNSSNNWQPA